jgi:hypothetical protein
MGFCKTVALAEEGKVEVISEVKAEVRVEVKVEAVAD